MPTTTNEKEELITELIAHRTSNKLKGTFITYPEEVDWDQMSEVQKSFSEFIKPKCNGYATLLSITPRRAVMGIPFDYGISMDGGHYTFYLFGDISKEYLQRAKKKLKNSQDVVSVKTERVELVAGWTPPNESAYLATAPTWINNPDVNYMDGMEL